jgi:hypothetical protein
MADRPHPATWQDRLLFYGTSSGTLRCVDIQTQKLRFVWGTAGLRLPAMRSFCLAGAPRFFGVRDACVRVCGQILL